MLLYITFLEKGSFISFNIFPSIAVNSSSSQRLFLEFNVLNVFSQFQTLSLTFKTENL